MSNSEPSEQTQKTLGKMERTLKIYSKGKASVVSMMRILGSKQPCHVAGLACRPSIRLYQPGLCSLPKKGAKGSPPLGTLPHVPRTFGAAALWILMVDSDPRPMLLSCFYGA